MLSKDHYPPITANILPVDQTFLINGRQLIRDISDVTLHVNMTPLTAEDRLLIKTLQAGKKARLSTE